MSILYTVGFSLSCFLALCSLCGCTPSHDSKDNENMTENCAVTINALTIKIDELASQIKKPSPDIWKVGDEVGTCISKIQDLRDRRDFLARFRHVVLTTPCDDEDILNRERQRSAVEKLGYSYLYALKLSRTPVEEALDFQLAFVERVKMEIMELNVVSNDVVDVRMGVHWASDMYLNALKYEYDCCVRRLEEMFNEYSSTISRDGSASEIRQKIERSIGRRIRTDEEIRGDRRSSSRMK